MDDNKLRALLNITTAAGVALALVLVGTADHEEAVRAQAERAEMEALYCESDGEYGWPPAGGCK